MLIRVYSDLHLDHYNADNLWYPPELIDDKDTILVIPGDLWVGTRFIEYGEGSWISKVAARFKYVVVVLGNHDMWPGNHALTIKSGGDTCNAMLQDRGIFNVKVLDCDAIEIDDILFVGCTLWTDMDNEDAVAMYNMPRAMAYDGKCAYETGPNGQWSRFTSERWVHTHRRHKAYLKRVVENNKDKNIVVVTHHLPLRTLGDPNYSRDASNAYYMSDLSDFILDNPHIKLWCYGHTHHQRDTWMVNTRLLNNCVGYPGQHMEQQGLVSHVPLKLEHGKFADAVVYTDHTETPKPTFVGLQAIEIKYDNHHGAVFETPDEFYNNYFKDCGKTNPSLSIALIWLEEDMTLIEIYDNNMRSEIVVIKQPHLYDHTTGEWIRITE